MAKAITTEHALKLMTENDRIMREHERQAAIMKEKAAALDWLDCGIMAGKVQLDRQHRFNEGPAMVQVWDDSKGWLFYTGETVLAAIQAAMQAETE